MIWLKQSLSCDRTVYRPLLMGVLVAVRLVTANACPKSWRTDAASPASGRFELVNKDGLFANDFGLQQQLDILRQRVPIEAYTNRLHARC